MGERLAKATLGEQVLHLVGVSVENKIKHLEMIEAVIERMGKNSFQLKGWAVTLIVLVGGLASDDQSKKFFLLGFIPLFAFWFLDSYYLMIERRYTALYKIVTRKDDACVDFSMDAVKAIHDDGGEAEPRFGSCLFALSEWVFYGLLLASVLVLGVVLYCT